MSQNNFVIQDVVAHVYSEDDYHPSRAVGNAFRKILRNSWIFLVIIGLSAGIGYVAVYLPDTIAQKAGSMESAVGIPRELQGLSDTQKKELMEQFRGQR